MNSVIPFSDVNFQQSDIIMLDTCILLNYFGHGDNEPVIKQCKDLIQNGTDNGAMFVYSGRTLEEFANIILRDSFKKALAIPKISQAGIKALRRKNPHQYKAIIDIAQKEINNYRQQIGNQPSIFPEAIESSNSEVFGLAYQIESKYDFPAYGDTEQVAVTLQNDIPYLATNDQDYCSVNEPGLNILVDSYTYRTYLKSLPNATNT